MSLSSCLANPPISLQVDLLKKRVKSFHNDGTGQRLTLSPRSDTADFFGGSNFVGGSKLVIRPERERFNLSQKSSGIRASWMSSSQIASSVFGVGTVAVLPFYALMVLAPKSELTKRSMQSSIPYVVLGVLYSYLLYLSWTPETMRLIFSNKYLLPELPSIAKMFSSEMTLASAWIHLLVVDLFAARQVFHDGEENQVETRHSVSLCLLFCPVGILTHCVTKSLTRSASATSNTH